jgi:hypothetical protein
MSEEVSTGGEGLPEEEFSALMQSISSAAPLVKGLLHSPLAGSASHAPPGRCERREALLCALKPYLSPERCAAADYLLRLWRVGDSIKALGGTHVHPTDV